MKNLINCFLILIGITFNVYGQFSIGGTPASLQDGFFPNKFKSGSTTYNLPNLNNNLLLQESDNICTSCKKTYYGKHIPVSINIKSAGKLTIMKDGSKVWLLRMESPTAYAMQFFFSKFNLPEDATLYIFNENVSMILGGYTKWSNPANNSATVQFGTEYIEGKNILIEYHEPANPEFSGEVILKSVVHIFRDIFKKGNYSGGDVAGPCNINIACPEASGWGNEIQSVGIILNTDVSPTGSFMGFCSGALINNTKNDGRPLFLTARHCSRTMDPEFTTSTWLFKFNHQAKDCNSNTIDSKETPAVYGCNILSADGAINNPAGDGVISLNSDYLLLELVTNIDFIQRYKLCLAGWNFEPNSIQPPYVGIHHPLGDVKKISISNNIESVTKSESNELSPNGQYWKLTWSKGTTHGGSSGSPLFNSSHQIIGQLYGGLADCDGNNSNGQPDWYGKFGTSWEKGNFKPILDPMDYTKYSKKVETYCPIDPNSIPPSPPQYDIYERCYTELKNDGFLINGQNKTLVKVCSGEKIEIRKNDKFNLTCCGFPTVEITRVKRDQDYDYTKKSDCREQIHWFIGGGLLPKRCTYIRIFISVWECDENFNLIGNEYCEWKDALVSDIYCSKNYLTSFNLLDYLPSNAKIEMGKYYKIKVAGTNPSYGWDEATRYICVGTKTALSFSSGSITNNQQAKTITIRNTQVNSSIEIKAGELIEIYDGSILNSGTYLIDERFKCD